MARKRDHENGISKKTIFHSHTHMTDPPIVASHYFKEDFDSRTKISRYVIAYFGVCGFSKKKNVWCL